MAKNPIFNLLANLAVNLITEKLQQGQREQQKPQGFPEIGDLPDVQRLKHKEGGVILIVGRREIGKSVCARRIAQVIGKPTYAISPEEKPPDWIEELKLEQIAEMPPPYSSLILDDLPVYLSSHQYNSPFARLVEGLIPVVRHRRKLILIFCTQAASLSNRFTLDADVVVLKAPNILFQSVERDEVARLYKDIGPVFDRMTELQLKQYAFVITQSWRGLVRVNKDG